MTPQEEYNSPENQRKLRAAREGVVAQENAKSTGRPAKPAPAPTTGEALVGGINGLKAAAEALKKARRK